MDKLFKSTRLQVALVSCGILIGVEVLHALTGIEVSADAKGWIATTLLTLMGLDTVRPTDPDKAANLFENLRKLLRPNDGALFRLPENHVLMKAEETK